MYRLSTIIRRCAGVASVCHWLVALGSRWVCKVSGWFQAGFQVKAQMRACPLCDLDEKPATHVRSVLCPRTSYSLMQTRFVACHRRKSASVMHKQLEVGTVHRRGENTGRTGTRSEHLGAIRVRFSLHTGPSVRIEHTCHPATKQYWHANCTIRPLELQVNH